MAAMFNYRDTRKDYRRFEEMISDTEKYGVSFGTRSYNDFIEDCSTNFRRSTDLISDYHELYSGFGTASPYETPFEMERGFRNTSQTGRPFFSRKVSRPVKNGRKPLYTCTVTDIDGLASSVSNTHLSCAHFPRQEKALCYPHYMIERADRQEQRRVNDELFVLAASEYINEKALCGCWPIANTKDLNSESMMLALNFLYLAGTRDAACWLWAFINTGYAWNMYIFAVFICAYLCGYNILEELVLDDYGPVMVNQMFEATGIYGVRTFETSRPDDLIHTYEDAFMLKRFGCDRSRRPGDPVKNISMEQIKTFYLPRIRDAVETMKRYKKDGGRNHKLYYEELLDRYGDGQ